jgi:hypothetical protein
MLFVAVYLKTFLQFTLHNAEQRNEQECEVISQRFPGGTEEDHERQPG